ncbi:MAG: glycosyltransferase [Paludibacter sp.]|nr:glycosyltransferase [Paludibacter sp.]
MEILKFIFRFVDSIIFVFGIVIMLSYIVLAIFSAIALYYYMHKNKFIDYTTILSSSIAPSVTILAPAYNEGVTVVDNVRSLMSLHYVNLEIIIINDGSKDDTLEKLIESYQLKQVRFEIDYKIPCNRVRGVYRSENQAFQKLIVVDKENGGKADALNAGINIASNELITSIDVDCILESDAILKMVKPFVEETDKKVIASGGVIRVANNCDVGIGKINKVRFPNKLLAGFQVLEYSRAFILGRMAWSRINGLMLISGAFGMFDKDLVIKVGGYDKSTVGEDMELVVRMRRYMHDMKQGGYIVSFIPDPLCWTEVPDTLKVLGRQRDRWTRGTMDTLFMHKVMFFNPKYNLLGMLSYPYWFFFEWLAPYVELFGLIYFGILVYLGLVNWLFFGTLLTLVYAFAFMLTLFSVYFEESTFNTYKRKVDILKMIGLALLEPFIYHPMVVYWAIKGNISYFKGEKGWGKIERTGFSTRKSK